jgi:hypothetical protein
MTKLENFSLDRFNCGRNEFGTRRNGCRVCGLVWKETVGETNGTNFETPDKQFFRVIKNDHFG